MSKRIFIAFAVEDKWARDYLVGQAKNSKTPLAFTDYSVKSPFDSAWKTRCRARIRSCDGMIGLVSKYTRLADGAKWEMATANEEGVPLVGVHIHKDDKGQIPPQLSGKRILTWTWTGIANWINNL